MNTIANYGTQNYSPSFGTKLNTSKAKALIENASDETLDMLNKTKKIITGSEYVNGILGEENGQFALTVLLPKRIEAILDDLKQMKFKYASSTQDVVSGTVEKKDDNNITIHYLNCIIAKLTKHPEQERVSLQKTGTVEHWFREDEIMYKVVPETESGNKLQDIALAIHQAADAIINNGPIALKEAAQVKRPNMIKNLLD